MSAFEQEFVEWIGRRSRPSPCVDLGIGDDMAMVRGAAPTILISSDILLDGVHFDTRRDAFDAIGRKAVACSLSDCAAMAVRPLAATISIAWSNAHTMADAQSLYKGMESIAEAFDLAIVGGDTTRWSSPLAIDVTIMANPYPGVAPVQRNGATIGDRLYVTGRLGGSLRGKHLDFTPRVSEARHLAESLGSRLHAMMDISDGLSLDLWRLCQASGVGAELDENLIQRIVSEDGHILSQTDNQPALDHALSDGEDFELLLAVDGSANDTGVALWEIGGITERGLAMRHADGHVATLEPRGFLH